MSDFGTVTFDRIKEQYADIDTGAGALFSVISQLLQEMDVHTALEIADEAARIYSEGDSFIEEGVTTNTDVFLEVFRRVLFTPEPKDKATLEVWRQQIVTSASYLGNIRMYLLRRAL